MNVVQHFCFSILMTERNLNLLTYIKINFLKIKAFIKNDQYYILTLQYISITFAFKTYMSILFFFSL